MQKLITAIPDALIVAGVGAISYGAGLLLPAAGYIVAGVFGVGFGVLASLKAPTKVAE
ncbi:MAG: hypothetical protein JWO28_284 [Hyphomicrobiales bacterium]|nr:hypothetical protein [Hyphomicrobiales bacterium]